MHNLEPMRLYFYILCPVFVDKCKLAVLKIPIERPSFFGFDLGLTLKLPEIFILWEKERASTKYLSGDG